MSSRSWSKPASVLQPWASGGNFGLRSLPLGAACRKQRPAAALEFEWLGLLNCMLVMAQEVWFSMAFSILVWTSRATKSSILKYSVGVDIFACTI